MQGAYGKVRFVGGCQAVKRTSMYDDTFRTIIGNNITEAALGVTVCKRLPHVIRIHEARYVAGNAIELAMDKGDMTLFEYIRDTPFIERMRNMDRILRGLLIGLHALHTRRLAHCDLKVTNIIIERGSGDPVIIDLGSVRFVKRAHHGEAVDVMCTYVFSAPESLVPSARPTFEHDAYSLGVVLHYYIFKTYMAKEMLHAQTREEALKMFTNNLPGKCPDFVDPKIFEAMLGLLHADPAKRTSIRDLVEEFIEPTTPVLPDLILDRARPLGDRGRPDDIDDLFEIALSPGSFPLAVSIRDRSGAKGPTEIAACALLAHMTLYPDTEVPRPSKKCSTDVLKDIIRRVNFELYADTAEWVLWLQHGVAKPDPEMLRDAIKEADGDTMLAVRLYLRKQPSPESSPDHKRRAVELM